MRREDAFSGYHPAVNFIFFASVLAFSMIFTDPASIIISFCAASLYAVCLKGIKYFAKMSVILITIGAAAVLINCAFNHKGATILFYLPSGNPMTLESIAYGAAASLMAMTMIVWFAGITEVLSSDKFVYLFGRRAPALSIILSMSIRFFPDLIERFRTVSEARKVNRACVGKDGRLSRLREAASVFSIMVTWCLERGIMTADSMKNRGYGLNGRTSFTIYRFERRDRIIIAVMMISAAVIVFGGIRGAFSYSYFPFLGEGVRPGAAEKAVFGGVYLVFCMLPLIVDIREEMKWRHLRSEI